MKKILVTLGLMFVFTNLSSQHLNEYTLTIGNGAESRELLDLLSFEEVYYKKIKITGTELKDKFYIITATEYWDKELFKADTIINTKKFGIKNNSNELEFRILSKKTAPDSVKFQIFQPRLATIKKYKTKETNTYSLRDPSNGKPLNFIQQNKTTFLAYSLPYEDPTKPGYLFYCELSSDGVPTREWGTRYGVKHYIVFDIEIIE